MAFLLDAPSERSLHCPCADYQFWSSTPGGVVVADPCAPTQHGNGEEEQPDQWRGITDSAEHTAARVVEQGSEGQVVGAGKRHHKGEEATEPGTIDGERILGRFGAAIGDRVHDLQRLDGPERERGLEDEQTSEDSRPSQDRGEEQRNPRRGPGDPEGVHGPHQNDDSLCEPSQAHQLELASQHLQGGAAGAQQQTVEIAVFDQRWKGVEAARDRLRQRKGDIDHPVEERDLREFPATEIAESVEQCPHPDKLGAGCEQVARAEQ